jgi:hypothetical protein
VNFSRALSAEAVADTLGRDCSTALGLRKRCAMRVWWGAVAQLGERLVRNEEVSGSIPLSSTNIFGGLLLPLFPFLRTILVALTTLFGIGV